MSKHAFSDSEKQAVYRAIAERRDMRHFNGEPVDEQVLARLLQAAHQAPSVGLMQPWRIMRITDVALRAEIRDLVEKERVHTADALGERSAEFMRLKVEGIDQCAEVFVMALQDQREHHVFGRRTLPEMDLASVSCAIQNLWLAARAEGIGVGWVSLFDPQQLSDLLNMPTGSKPVAVLCIGHVDEFYSKPMLELEGWTQAKPLDDFLWENGWQNTPMNEE
ncbi:5,6-dimethylbenzimidazole synthase [Litoribacillus peritrichatus]|uniref:5,6-dimethylbenzimidazole synthase n=1 Tax=Litoribacillus peritrichatus TaxID=718191 RepID=A0ABP7MFJ2_9GAMM